MNELLPDESITDVDSESCGGSDFVTQESRTEDVVGEEEASDDEQEEHITQAFIEAVGGQLQVDREVLNSAALWDLEWRPVQATLEDSTTEYSKVIVKGGAPTSARRKLAHSPLERFFVHAEGSLDRDRRRLKPLPAAVALCPREGNQEEANRAPRT